MRSSDREDSRRGGLAGFTAASIDLDLPNPFLLLGGETKEKGARGPKRGGSTCCRVDRGCWISPEKDAHSLGILLSAKRCRGDWLGALLAAYGELSCVVVFLERGASRGWLLFTDALGHELHEDGVDPVRKELGLKPTHDLWLPRSFFTETGSLCGEELGLACRRSGGG